MNKRLIICAVIGLIFLTLIIAIILSNKQNTNSNELETNQNYSNTGNLISNENIKKIISSNQNIENTSPITENLNITIETNSTKKENITETSIQEQVTEKNKRGKYKYDKN